jgi:hypothetical protein
MNSKPPLKKRWENIDLEKVYIETIKKGRGKRKSLA